MLNRPTMTLADYSVDQARAAFDRLHHAWDLVPATHQIAFEQDWAAIAAVAARTHLTTADDLVRHQSKILTSLTGLKSVTVYLAAEPADNLHRYRNTIVAVAAAAGAELGVPLETVCAGSVTGLKARTARNERALVDDEITLLRTSCAITVSINPASKPAAVYALCDAGQRIKETTLVGPDDLDDIDHPTLVHANGSLPRVAPRTLPLDPFASLVLAKAARAALAPKRKSPLLAYTPQKNQPGSPAAGISASGVARGAMSQVGLAHNDVTASSITRWRVNYAWFAQGALAATQISGLDRNATYAFGRVNDKEQGPKEIEFITDFDN